MTRIGAWVAALRGTRRLWLILLYSVDAAVVVIATVLAYYARFDGVVPGVFVPVIPWAIMIAALVYLVLFTVFGLYRLVLRYVGVDTMLRLFAATGIGFAALIAIDLVAPDVAPGTRAVPFGVLFIQALLVFLGAGGARLVVRVALLVRGRQSRTGRRILIIGAGSAGSLLLHEIQNRPDLELVPVGFLDENPNIRGHTIGGIPVLGLTEQLGRVAHDRGIDEVIVAMPSATRESIRRVLNQAADAGLTTRVMPSIVLETGAVRLSDLREVDVEDLLGREPTPIDIGQVAETIAGKVVMVTGAAGSIGSELCRQMLGLDPKRLVLVEIDETRLYELWLELEQMRSGVAVMSLCDIRDRRKLDEVFATERPAVVLHAAAYKHVPVMELSPAEAVKTNVLGTLQVVEACEKFGAERFVLVSTDKAVAPANVMGLTKSIAEKVMMSAACRGRMIAVAVRFGNVLASRGSVVPLFEDQLSKGGPLRVTDPEVTRYFMTIPEASRLILQAQAIGGSGDVFVLEMGEPVAIVDLARKMIALSGVPAQVEFVGLRPGEKLHESLIFEHEDLEPTSRPGILRVHSALECDSRNDEAIRELISAAESGREEDLQAAFARLDPEFAERQRVVS